MLHSGGAHGGHYSAYVKDTEGIDASEFEDRTPEEVNQIREDRWYHFNDSYVKKISITELADAFGRNAITASANAYMLMYRLIEGDNGLTVPMDEINEELQEEVMQKLQNQQTRTVAAMAEKAKMQLKIIHVQSNGNDDEFEQIG